MRTRWFAVSVFLVVGVMLLSNLGQVRAAGTMTMTTVTSCVSATGTNVVVVGQPATCAASVMGSSPTGTVSWSTTGMGTFAPPTCTLVSGTCSVQYTPSLASGTSISASYGGDGSNNASNSTALPISVEQATPTLSANCASVVVGSTATCFASLNGGYNPMGNVTFSQTGGPAISIPSPSCSTDSGPCSITVTTKSAGTVALLASYSGDPNNAAQGTSVVLIVSPAQSTTLASCSTQTVVIGASTTCSATVTGFSPTGTINWVFSGKGTLSANFCLVPPESCGVTLSPTSSGTITASYSGDKNNTGSYDTVPIAANINATIQITVADGAPTTSVTLSGCSVSPSAIPADGNPHSFQASSGCTITVTLPSPGASFRYLTATGQNSLTIGSCTSSSCQAFSAPIYGQFQNEYQASPKSPAVWGAPGSIGVTGTALGLASQPICTITVSTGSGGFSCQGWTDYGTPAVMGALQVSQTERWATAQSSFTDTTMGNQQYTSSYYSQVLESFEYTLAGSATAPSAPALSYTSFGGGASLPLVGSASSVWLDSGSSWSVPAALQGSTSGERWESTLTSGAATAAQTVSLVYYHQFLVDFAFSVVGGGTAYSPPSASFTAFAAPAKGSQGWVDAGSAYNYTNPLAGSTPVERWLTAAPAGAISGPGTVNAIYYHQLAFVLSYAVSGGGVYSNPRLNYTSLGTPALEQLNGTQTAFWLDDGTKWGVTPLLPSSSSTERWITKEASSGTAAAPTQLQLLYYHQYLGTLHYSIQGTGGSPAVPRLNYTFYGVSLLSPLNATASPVWVDSGSSWGVPLTLPGGHGERWLSNVTGLVSADSTFVIDAQYTHQFYVEVGVSTPVGGQVANADQWKDQDSSVILSATSAKLWSFAYWQGATPFSYNGTTRLPTLTVSGPANETAIFFPGLNLSADSQGSVAYSYGSINGTVEAGANTTIYVPPGRNVTLTARPNTVEIMFSGWTGNLAGTQLQRSVAISSPGVVHAGFVTDYADIRTFVVATIGVFVAACYVFIIRRGFIPKAIKK
jgi:hypothetical protein